MKTHLQYSNLLVFDIFDAEKDITHFTTTREGGVSTGEFFSFNMGNFSDDSPLNIYENRMRLARMFYMDLDEFITPHQTHGTKVLSVNDDFLNLEHSNAIETLYGIDAVVTDVKGIFLCVNTADCVPVILYDKKRRVTAAIHAGWKGTGGRILENCIYNMQDNYGSSADDIVAGIGPAISMVNYEVGVEVVDYFVNNGFDISNPSVYKKNKTSIKYNIDLKEINRRELIRLGVSESRIEKSELCTFDNDKLFFSARRQTVHSGRMLTGIMMNG